MTERRVKAVQPFAFQADFSAPKAEPRPEPDAGRLSAAELAQLGARLQADAISNAQDPLDALAAERLDHAIARLGDALTAFSDLADQLDRLAHQSVVPGELAGTARRAAMAIHDGQGDLFAVCQSMRGQTKSTS